MKNRLPFILLAWVIADVYFFQAVNTLTSNGVILWSYWLVDVLLAAGFAYLVGQRSGNRTPARLISWLMAVMLLTLIPKIFALPVLLLEDITRLFRGFPPRSVWVSELAVLVAFVPFVSLIYGITGGRHHYKVHRVTLTFDDLPPAFDGFTIARCRISMQAVLPA